MTLIGKLQNHDTRTSSTNKMSNAFVNHHAIIHFGKSFFFFFCRQIHFGKSQVYYWRLFLRLSTISNFSPMYIYKGNFGGRLEARHNKNIPVP